MANDETRVEEVTENIEAVEDKYGENWKQLLLVTLKDISVSLAMLVDGGSSDA